MAEWAVLHQPYRRDQQLPTCIHVCIFDNYRINMYTIQGDVLLLIPLGLSIVLNEETECIIIDVMSSSYYDTKLVTDQVQLKLAQVRHQTQIIQHTLELCNKKEEKLNQIVQDLTCMRIKYTELMMLLTCPVVTFPLWTLS